MARISLSICDLCKKTTDDDLGTITISFPSIDYDKVKHIDVSQNGEICKSCYDKIEIQLGQEAQPMVPGAALSTPSDSAASPDFLDELKRKYLKTGVNPGLSDEQLGTLKATEELLENEVTYIPSNFTAEKRREAIKEKAKECDHKFSMSDDGKGISCKICGERARF